MLVRKPRETEMKTWILFDWGNTLMRAIPGMKGPMRDWPRVEAMPGVRQTLRLLHGKVGLAVATGLPGAQEADVRAALAREDLETFFKRVFCPGNLGLTKSDPGFYPAVAQALHSDPAHLVMVGDHFQEDCEAALSAGLHAIWYDAGAGETRIGHHLTTIHHLEALPGVLMGWGMLPRE